ncbi:hypothetical protein Mame01_51990 [Microbispora amethystogenes]|nr:hypothetical protein Mame01_51990 [Microbispora amethystogenes]
MTLAAGDGGGVARVEALTLGDDGVPGVLGRDAARLQHAEPGAQGPGGDREPGARRTAVYIARPLRPLATGAG